MRRKWFLLSPVIFLLLGCISAVWTAAVPTGKPLDVIALRRAASEAAVHWENLEQANFQDFPYTFSILSLDGTVRYRTGEDALTDINKALSTGNPVLDVETDRRILGRVIVTTSPESLLAPYRNITVTFLLTLSLFSALLSFLYNLYLDRKIVKPFRQLEKFASHVAEGNFDFMIKRAKSNLFGAFTESFDMLREQLLLARERELRANRSQKELVASISHDIKTPVTSIRLTSELLLELETDERLRGKIRSIYEKTEEIEALVNNLFHNTLQDIDQLTVTPKAMYSGEIKRILSDTDYEEKALLSPVPECMVYLDELRFTQVLSNILGNSYKYAGTSIQVMSSLTDTHLKICICDQGPGVPEEELPLLFNQFYRGSNSSGMNGSGLGLYICKKIMEQMQGEIYCTCFHENFTVVLLLKLV